jgi:hypothetical protein
MKVNLKKELKQVNSGIMRAMQKLEKIITER